MPEQTAIAIGAHPDDIEYMMAGTLLRLKAEGWDIHYLNLSTGSCGSVQMNAQQTREVREREAKAAAGILGATWHPPLCDDLEILYELPVLRRIASVIRNVKPSIVLTHYPEDYMEDHTNTCRLAVTAAFTHGMPNFETDPPSEPYYHDVVLYHGMPHGLCDGLRRPVEPEFFVETTAVQETKLKALAAHDSQQNWLDVSQGQNSYLQTLVDFSLELGRRSGKQYEHAEGWTRHLHWGFSGEEIDPLRDMFG